MQSVRQINSIQQYSTLGQQDIRRGVQTLCTARLQAVIGVRSIHSLNFATLVTILMSRVTRSQSTCFPSPYLPVELWAEIISYLPRYILKSLFIFHPHPLGKIASHVYFSTLSLHFSIFHDHKRYADMYRSCCESNDEWLKWHDELVKWHNKRSCDILMTIMRSDFGNRIQKLRIYAGSDGQTDTLALQIGVVCFFQKQICHSFQ